MSEEVIIKITSWKPSSGKVFLSAICVIIFISRVTRKKSNPTNNNFMRLDIESEKTTYVTDCKQDKLGRSEMEYEKPDTRDWVPRVLQGVWISKKKVHTAATPLPENTTWLIKTCSSILGKSSSEIAQEEREKNDGKNCWNYSSNCIRKRRKII